MQFNEGKKKRRATATETKTNNSLEYTAIPIRSRRMQEVGKVESKPLQVRGEEAQPHNTGDSQTVGFKGHGLWRHRITTACIVDP